MNVDQLRAAFPDIRYYASIDSTMNAAASLPRGSIVIAEEQTAGQGRHGHSWHSESGAGVYCSVVRAPSPGLTLAAGLAAVDAIAQTTGITCDLRWPNDLMLDDKKCGGILVQLVGGDAIVGIGINVNHPSFPAELSAQATSLRIHSGREFAREPIVIALVPALELYASSSLENILDLFTHASSYVSGRRVVVRQPGSDIRGVTEGLDASGFLKVRQDDGTVTLILAGGVRAASA